MARSRSWRVLAAASVLVLALGACGGDDDDDSGSDATGGGSGSSGVTITGSSTVEPISSRVAELFNQENADVPIDVSGPGTGDGFEIFCAGEADITDASRPISEEEVVLCEDAGVEFVELKVAIDGLAVITSTNNDAVECLSFADLYALLGPEAQGETWADADDLAGELPEGFGTVNAPYPDAPLVIAGPGEESGTYDSFVDLALADIAEERGLAEEEIATRPDYQASPNDNVIVEAIGGTDTSLGWVGYAFAAENEETIQTLAVDGGDGCIEDSEETIRSGEYPLARDLFIYVNVAKAEENSNVAAFVDLYLSDEGIASVSDAGYVDLAEEDLTATRDAWDSRTTGTNVG